MRIRALTYNMSWASQAGVEAGSEADFVRACKLADTCFAHAVRLLREHASDVHVAGFQEVNLFDFETQVDLPLLDAHRRGIVTTSTGAYAAVSLMWNRRKLGSEVWHCAFDMDVGRPCLLVLTSRRLLLIVAHFPYIDSSRKRDKLAKKISERAVCVEYDHIIIMADTNDYRGRIHADNPLDIDGHAVSHQEPRGWAQKNLITCCWHEDGHKHASMSTPGDYIMADTSVRVQDQHTPRAFITTDAVASDHRPVVATLVLE